MLPNSPVLPVFEGVVPLPPNGWEVTCPNKGLGWGVTLGLATETGVEPKMVEVG